jgi:hypothetical protein
MLPRLVGVLVVVLAAVGLQAGIITEVFDQFTVVAISGTLVLSIAWNATITCLTTT